MHTSPNAPMKLVLITNANKTKFEIELINRLFKEGLDELHIRKPDFAKDDYIKFIDNIDPEYHPRLILHDYYSLVHQYDISKIHISRTWRDSSVMNFILDRIILRGKKVQKTICVSKCADIYKQTNGIDEAMLGPVFAGSMYVIDTQAIKTEELARANRHSKIPLMGLGGANIDTIDTFKEAGFSGVVLQTCIWNSPEPVRTFIQIRDKAHAHIAKPHQLRIAI